MEKMVVCFLQATTINFGHNKIIKFCNRPFSSVEEMDEEMIKRWNEKIGPRDTVYHLGDFSFDRNPSKYFDRLNGHKILIKGNHDSKAVIKLRWQSIHDMYELRHDRKFIVLCHYSLRVWNKSHYGSYCLFGHSHGTIPPHGLSFDVGVDCHDFYPLSYEDVCKRMDELNISNHAEKNDNRIL